MLGVHIANQHFPDIGTGKTIEGQRDAIIQLSAIARVMCNKTRR
jgi:hypothetical protein